MIKLTPFDVFSEALAKEKAQRGLPRLSVVGPPPMTFSLLIITLCKLVTYLAGFFTSILLALWLRSRL